MRLAATGPWRRKAACRNDGRTNVVRSNKAAGPIESNQRLCLVPDVLWAQQAGVTTRTCPAQATVPRPIASCRLEVRSRHNREWSWHKHNTAAAGKHSNVAALKEHHVEEQPRCKISSHGIIGRVFVGSESNFAGSGPAQQATATEILPRPPPS
jgi:hypothetical protein